MAGSHEGQSPLLCFASAESRQADISKISFIFERGTETLAAYKIFPKSRFPEVGTAGHTGAPLGLNPRWSQIRELESQPAAPALPRSPSSRHLCPRTRGESLPCPSASEMAPPGAPWSPLRGVRAQLSQRMICRAAVVDRQQIIELSGSLLSKPPTSGASLGNSLRKRPSPHAIWKWFLKNLLIIVKKQHIGFCKI